MVGVDIITELVNTVFLTGCLSTDPPQSLILISSPESGKTSVCERSDLKSVLFYTDLIGSGMLEDLRANQEANHLVIRDMVMVMAHKDATNKRTLAVMMALTSDGLGKVALGKNCEYDFKGRRAGFICCITSDMVNDERRWWRISGFASRMIPFNYRYSEDLQVAIIQQTIENGAYENPTQQKLLMPAIKHNIAINAQFSKDISILATEVAHGMKELGFRRGKHFRALVRAHALLRSAKEVGQEDILFLKRISPYIDFEKSEEIKYHTEKKCRPPKPNRAPHGSTRNHRSKSKRDH